MEASAKFLTLVESVTELEREDVAAEPRHWVRIARACNNHCVFCLDSDVQDGTMIPRGEVERDIERGRGEGATRLILSGGEATIHPDFLHFVKLGKALGYEHVQTITNGRMFAYGEFTRRAVSAGLDEVTFSLHGHTAELSDELTGVPGSFAQTVAGIRNVVGTGIIVSGDVVVNRRNVRHLRSILELFMTLGVREFDILMVVPFGRASPEEGGELLFDAASEIEHLHSALMLSRDPTLHVWTNRLDPMLLEGFENLIQDPHKLHDEVRGRRGILRDLVEGRPMRCAGPRCSHCFIRHLCGEMQAAVARLGRGVPGILRVALDGPAPARPALDLVSREREVLWIRARDADEASRLEGVGRSASLWLSLLDLRGLGDAVAAGLLPAPDRIIVSTAEQVEQAMDLGPPEILVAVNGSTARAAATIRGTRLVLAHRPCLTLRESVERDVDLRGALAGARADAFVDIPPCLSGGSGVRYEDPFDAAVVGEDGLIDPDRFVDHFVRWLYRTKSARCRSCVFDDSCRGISINLARRSGLGILEPRGS